MPLDFPNNPTLNQQYLNWIWNGTAWVVTAAQPVPFYDNVGRNLLHNGLFNIQQRGAGPWVQPFNNWYTADRWLVATSSDTVTVNLIALADADRAQISDEAATNAHQIAFTGSSTAGAYTQFNHRIEGVRRLSGKTVTYSFWARATTGTPRIGVFWWQHFGAGGSPSADIGSNLGVTPALSATWQRYSVTGVFPSASGKTFGTTAGTDWSQIGTFLSEQGNNSVYSGGIGVQSGTVQFWGMQLEIGSTATPLEKLDPRMDLANCQRFYVVQTGYLYGFAVNTTNLIVLWTFPVQMRATPTITLLTTAPYSEQPPFNTAHTGSGSALSGTHANNSTGFDIQITGFSGYTAGAVASLGANCLAASADL